MSARVELNDLDNRVNEVVRLLTNLMYTVSELSAKVNAVPSTSIQRQVYNDRLDRIEVNRLTGELKVSTGAATSSPIPPASTSGGWETVAIVKMPGWQGPLTVRQG